MSTPCRLPLTPEQNCEDCRARERARRMLQPPVFPSDCFSHVTALSLRGKGPVVLAWQDGAGLRSNQPHATCSASKRWLVFNCRPCASLLSRGVFWASAQPTLAHPYVLLSTGQSTLLIGANKTRAIDLPCFLVRINGHDVIMLLVRRLVARGSLPLLLSG